jgi:large subunit ribosomal protein L5
MTRLKERYVKDVVPALRKEFGYVNVMAVPKLTKIVVNMGLGEATQNAKIVDAGGDDLGRITGQKPAVLDRLISIALPRVRDFKGVSPRGFDGRGNYTLGLRDQLLFPEIDYLKVDKARGMNISMVTTAKTDEEARKLLQLMGMPFRAN